MDSDRHRHQLIGELFLQARELPIEARAAFLENACGGDAELRAEVESLLAAEADALHLEEAPLAGVVDELATAQADASQPAGEEASSIGPYVLLERLGEGGMGTVYLAQQTSPIQRRVALKVIKQGMDTAAVIARFQTERQTLALLDHPNVAQVLDAGATAQGRPFFVMELIQGVPITDYCDRNRLTTRQRLELFMPVCGAMHHAHDRGIIHRDLKPSNILVTFKDGTPIPKIIDFGIAKAMEQPLTERTLFTEQGALIGTPEYMSPEQAGSGSLNIDARSDIYSLGIVLYQLLAGALPFDRDELRKAAVGEIQRIICDQPPPKPSTRLRNMVDGVKAVAENRSAEPSALHNQVRGDLDWITMTAIDKDRARRYATASDLAADIQRHLAHVPVHAGPPSAAYRMKKFVSRNRGGVVACAIVLLALSAGLVGTLVQYFRAEEQSTRADHQEKMASSRGAEARAAKAREEGVLVLANVQRLSDARASADALWPAHPRHIEALRRWLSSRVPPLRENLPIHQARLRTLRAQALEYDAEQRRHDRATHPLAGELTEIRNKRALYVDELQKTQLQQEDDWPGLSQKTAAYQEIITDAGSRISELEGIILERRTWRFTDDETQRQHDSLAPVVSELQEFFDPDPHKGRCASVESRLAFALSIEERSITGAGAATQWAEAISDIALLTAYNGLRLQPQIGLLPLRRDPGSGLWEFWHIQSGARPEANPDPAALNPWLLAGDTGLIFVLAPGGTFRMGAQRSDPEGPNYDPHSGIGEGSRLEGPVHEVTLDPFFISKYEMTAAQWHRLTGDSPGRFSRAPLDSTARVKPVASVRWGDCVLLLDRLGLLLPTEAQWEYAARAGTATVWWTGDDKASIGVQRGGNLKDRSGRPGAAGTEPWDDGWLWRAPVGSFSPNPFGLHDTIGNVWEWSRDTLTRYIAEVAPGDGRRARSDTTRHVFRGGCYGSQAALARSAQRYDHVVSGAYDALGLRPVRKVDE